MKRKVALALAALLVCTGTVSGAESLRIYDDCENGVAKFGIAYSSREDTELPMIFHTYESFLDGAGLEMVPSGKIPYVAGNISGLRLFPYQGVYYTEYGNISEGETYSVSADIFTIDSNVKARIILMDNNDIVSISNEYSLEAGKPLNVEHTWTSDRETAKLKPIIAFYTKIRKSNLTNSIYIDNFSCGKIFAGASEWTAVDGTFTLDGAGGAVLTDTADGFADYSEIKCRINKSELTENEYALICTVSSDFSPAYLTASCDNIQNAQKDIIISSGAESTLSLPIDLKECSSEALELSISVKGEGDGTKSVRFGSIELVKTTHSAEAYQDGNAVHISGCLKKGNENSIISIKIADMPAVSVLTDAQGCYSYDADLPEGDAISQSLIISVSGIKGYSNDAIKTTLFYVNSDVYVNKVAGAVSAANTGSELRNVLTDEVLDSLGLAASRLYNSVDKTKVFDYLCKMDNSTFERLKGNFTACCALSALSEKQMTPSYVTETYKKELMLEEDAVYKDLYGKNTDFDSVYESFKGDVGTYKDFLERVRWSLVKSKVKNSVNYSEGMAVIKKYADELGLDLGKYSKLSSGKTAKEIAQKFTEYIKTMDDYSKAGRMLDSLCADGGGNANLPGGSGGGGSSGAVSFKPSSSAGLLPSQNKEPIKQTFEDLDDFEWAKDSVYALLDKGIVTMDEEHKFYPGREISRSEFVKMIAVMSGKTKYSGSQVFDDVAPDDWYYDYVMAMYEAGVIKGISNNEFGADANIKRQDICVILMRMLELEESNELTFADSDDISDYAKDAVAAVLHSGIVNGYEDKTFRPMNGASRAEAAKMINAASGI